MDYKENIKHRYTIEEKVYNSEKLTDSEKWWLKSNPMFNPRFDFPCYQRDVIIIPENKETVITVSVLSYGDNTRVYRPVIGIVGKGKISVENELFDINMNKSSQKTTKMLIPIFNDGKRLSTCTVISDSGLLSVAYQCGYYDDRMNIFIQEFSDGANLSYGLKRYCVSENEIIYYCKNPISNSDFDAFAFSIIISK